MHSSATVGIFVGITRWQYSLESLFFYSNSLDARIIDADNAADTAV